MSYKRDLDRTEGAKLNLKGIHVVSDVLDIALSSSELIALVHATVDQGKELGWGQHRRLRFDYFRPGEYYAGIVDKCLKSGASWLDVGGGDRLFSGFSALEHRLAQRTANLVAVDPSENVRNNKYATQCVQSTIENFHTDATFDLITARMVVEHVDDPKGFFGAVYRLLKPNGLFIVYTVNLWSAVTCISRIFPDSLHNPVKRLFWGTKPKDTFPTRYKLNTRHALSATAQSVSLDEVFFAYVDDCSILSSFRTLGTLELYAWSCASSVGMPYPEKNIVAVYRRAN